MQKEEFKVKNNLSGKVYNGVKGGIISGKLTAGTFLSEGATAAEYGVSKAPVKAAFRVLCEEGYLVSYARKGYQVTNLSESDFSKIQQVRYALESLIVVHLILYGKSSDIDELERIAALKVPSDKEYSTVNAQFHMAMAHLTGNRYLEDCLHSLFSSLSHLYTYLNTDDLEEDEQTCHTQLLDAIREKDKAAALRWLQEDKENNLPFVNRYRIISMI